MIGLESEACEGLDKPGEVKPCKSQDICPGEGTWAAGDWSNVSCCQYSNLSNCYIINSNINQYGLFSQYKRDSLTLNR